MAEAEATAWRKWWMKWWTGGEGGAGEREGDERVTAATAMASVAEGGETASVTAEMSEEEIARSIETSRQQGLWSEVPQRGHGAAARRGGGGDAGVWEQLKRNDPGPFRDLREGELKLGRKIAEGGQAQIYHASLNGHDAYVAKVFKMDGFSLAEFQRHWPRTRVKLPAMDAVQDNPVVGSLGEFIFGNYAVYCNCILHASFLKDGRFAIVMKRYWGDLRTLIDLRVKDNFQGPPFSRQQSLKIMREIASGLNELHDVGVLHRDLKAANVLIEPYLRSDPRYDDRFNCRVADYESSMLVIGTGFWRAPEVLEELMKQPCERKVDIWTEKVDAYSYAMTCYEVLTGSIPFFGYKKKDWKKIIDGERPHLPNHIDIRVQDLVERCWDKNPSKRPNFQAIVNTI